MSQRQHKRRVGLSVFAAWLLGALSLTAVACAEVPAAQPIHYVAVVDAGSSGSRIHLYEVSNHVVSEIPLEADEVDSPLAAFVDSPAEAGENVLKPLLAPIEVFAVTNELAREEITVNVLATAGMRKVDQGQATLVYADVAESIAQAGFAVGLTETITGQEEALYAWTDANELNQTLGSSEAEPIGIVEVGGASAQIAFALSSADELVTDAVSEITVNDVGYSVFTHSYLGLGQNDARTAMLNQGFAGASCYPNSADAGRQLILTDFITLPADQVSFDFTDCSEHYQQVITAAEAALPLDEVSALPGFAQSEFFGLSSVAFTALDFDLDANEAQAALASKVVSQCTGPAAAERVSELFAPDQQTFALHACANGTYISTLLEDLAIPIQNFTAAADIRGQSPSWARGFAILSAWGQA